MLQKHSMIDTALKENADYIEKCLIQRLDRANGKGDMAEAMAYSLLGGGKRIRAFLTIQFCLMFGGNADMAEPYASALEMIHAYSLIHDDMPCMDNDDMRRGKLSCHKKYGETIALLAGDALQTFAFETAAQGEMNTAKAVAQLAKSAGMLGMCKGQEIDLQAECADINELIRLHNLKTGALINAAATLGYFASGAEITDENITKIENYAYSVGLAFQIIDDLLDVRSTTAELGKPVGSDARNDKKTILTFMSEDEADAKAYQLSNAAAEIFAQNKNSDIIRELPLYLYKRKK